MIAICNKVNGNHGMQMTPRFIRSQRFRAHQEMLHEEELFHIFCSKVQESLTVARSKPQNWCSKIEADKILGAATQSTKVRGRLDWPWLVAGAPGGDITASPSIPTTMTIGSLRGKLRVLPGWQRWSMPRCSGDITGGRGSLDPGHL